MEYQHIHLRRDDPVPLYRQIAAAFIAAIQRGELQPFERLPAIRALAHTLGVSQVTITQTYEVLADEGYVASHVGRGTFVLPSSHEEKGVQTGRVPVTESAPVAGKWVQAWQAARPTTARRQWHVFLQEVMQRFSQADAPLYLSSAIPDPALFPVRRWQQSMQLGAKSLGQDLVNDDRAAFQYGSVLGDGALRTYLTGVLNRAGIHATPDEILLTSGTQQGLDLIARTFLTPNDLVATEALTYLDALDLFEHHGVTWLPIPMDDQGMRVDLLTHQLGAAQPQPRLVYTIPTGHNPTGITLSAERRQHLVQLAQERNLLVIADMVFDELFLDGSTPPALGSYDQDGRVLSVLSFNKTVFPALRMGCIVATRPLIEMLAQTKEIVDRAASLPLARALWRHLDSPHYQRELQGFRQHYRTQRDHLVALLERDLRPLGCHWTHPQAGLSLMVTLPREWDAMQVVLAAASHGLLLLPGQQFAPVPSDTWANSLRLAYGTITALQMDEALHRLVKVLHQTRRSEASGEKRSLRLPPQI